MKKIVLAGLFAITMIALSQQQASAWTNHRFSVGLNWNRQSGGNSIAWGLYRNGQPPGPETFGGGFMPGAPMHGFSAPMPQGYAPAPQGFVPPQPTMAEPPIAGHYASPYQFANYSRPVYYYPAPAYYYYSYGQ